MSGGVVDAYKINEHNRQEIKAEVERVLANFSQLDDRDVDNNAIALLHVACSQYSQWIFADFENSLPLETELAALVSAIATKYREAVEKFRGNAADPAFEYTYDRMNKIVKTMGLAYKEYIKRVIELFGATDSIKQLIPVLKINIPEPEIKPPNSSLEYRVTQTITAALCKLGDFSRYRTTLYFLKPENEHKHAQVYYAAAATVSPGDGVAPNQLGKLSASRHDYFATLYWFARAQSVEHPFAVDNVERIASKIAHMDFATLSNQSRLTVPSGGDRNVREAILYLVWIYARCYHVQITKKLKRLAVDQTEIDRACAQFRTIAAAQLIPSRTMIQLSLLGPMLIHLAETKTQLKRGEKNLQIYQLTMGQIGAVVNAALTALQGNQQQQEQVLKQLPSLRIYLDWLCKFLSVDVDWDMVGAQYQHLFRDLVQLVELLRQKYGFCFDPQTAVPTLSGRGAGSSMHEEEIVCMGVNAFNGGLSDTPSGYLPKSGDIAPFQHILFTAVEIARLNFTSVQFDEYKLVFSYNTSNDHYEEEDTDVESDEEVIFQPRGLRAARS